MEKKRRTCANYSREFKLKAIQMLARNLFIIRKEILYEIHRNIIDNNYQRVPYSKIPKTKESRSNGGFPSYSFIKICGGSARCSVNS